MAGAITPRRRRAPGGKAIVGGFLIAAAAVVIFAAVAGRATRHDGAFAVAGRPLAAGTTIGPGDLTTSSLGAASAVRSQLFSDPADLIGRTLAVAVAPGELIESGMLAGGPASALRPVDLSVAPWSLVGLAAGDPVDVLAGAGAASGSGSASASVSVVVRGATLLSVDQQSAGLLSGSATAGDVVTVGVANLSEVEALVGAGQNGNAVLVEAEPSDGAGLGPAPTG